jgi:hypothetical protein
MRPVEGFVAKFCQNLVSELDRLSYISKKIKESDWRFFQEILMRFTQLPDTERIVGKFIPKSEKDRGGKQIDFLVQPDTRKMIMVYSDTKNFLTGFKLTQESLDEIIEYGTLTT